MKSVLKTNEKLHGAEINCGFRVASQVYGDQKDRPLLYKAHMTSVWHVIMYLRVHWHYTNLYLKRNKFSLCQWQTPQSSAPPQWHAKQNDWFRNVWSEHPLNASHRGDNPKIQVVRGNLNVEQQNINLKGTLYRGKFLIHPHGYPGFDCQ